VDYHQRSLEMLEHLVPQLEEAVGMQLYLVIEKNPSTQSDTWEL